MQWDKNAIIRHAGIPGRDLRILGPLFSHSSNIHAREKAMVVNLEFIKAIVTAEEVLLLDAFRQEVLPLVEQLTQQLKHKSQPKLQGPTDEQESEMQVSSGRQWSPVPEPAKDFERGACPVLDELARNVSTKNLEHVRNLKSNLTRLLARVQKFSVSEEAIENSSFVTYNKNGQSGLFVGCVAAAGGLVFLLIFAYAKWKKLTGS